MGSPNMPKMTAALLRSYSEGALRNADELLDEASLLLDHNHNARAYFLAVAGIEEAGKALIAFDAQNRNLTDPAVCTKLKIHMENHSQKINYALSMWALSNRDQREALQMALELILHVKRGREPSMYSDLLTNPDRVQTPRDVVRPVAAEDCIRLAKNSLSYAHHHVNTKVPFEFSTAQDRMLTMKSGKFQELLNTEDFWLYYVARMEAGHIDMAEAVLGYERDHIKTGTLFRPGS